MSGYAFGSLDELRDGLANPERDLARPQASG